MNVACMHACRYLFNAGEGFQRFAMQHQIKLNRMTDVLLTRTSTDAAGGLPGGLYVPAFSHLMFILEMHLAPITTSRRGQERH
jgi:hypothetical protein